MQTSIINSMRLLRKKTSSFVSSSQPEIFTPNSVAVEEVPELRDMSDVPPMPPMMFTDLEDLEEVEKESTDVLLKTGNFDAETTPFYNTLLSSMGFTENFQPRENHYSETLSSDIVDYSQVGLPVVLPTTFFDEVANFLEYQPDIYVPVQTLTTEPVDVDTTPSFPTEKFVGPTNIDPVSDIENGTDIIVEDSSDKIQSPNLQDVSEETDRNNIDEENMVWEEVTPQPLSDAEQKSLDSLLNDMQDFNSETISDKNLDSN